MKGGKTAGINQPPRAGAKHGSPAIIRTGECEMKKQILLTAALAFTPIVFSGATFAQDDEVSAKNLYLAHSRDSKRGRPGVKITIELKRDGETRKVPLNYAFRAGDKVKFHFETNFNAYVKVINVGSTGALQLLYPYRRAPELALKGKDNVIPQGDLWFELDRNPGTEQLTFVFSSQPLLVAKISRVAMSGPNQGSGPGRSTRSDGDDQHALAELNSQSLENGKDFNLIQDTQENGNCAYGVAPTHILRKPIGVIINLRHQ
jgi:hypothetical protein